MSFYVYYGKLGTELLVAILPNGTVEVDDTLYLSSKKDLLAYRAREVTVTEDGEDRITFKDSYYSYTAVSQKGYKELSLIRSTEKGEKVTATLTRKYDQPQTAVPSSSKPKVWTGGFEFHDWAKNEEIVVVAPKGVGNKKPIVCLWQWSVDQNNEKGTLSHSVSEQQSDATTPAKFSFSQNNYYTVTCEVGSADEGLKVAVKGPANQGPKNAEVVQKQLKSAKVDLGAEHRFTPPRATQQKVSLDCSLPSAKPHLSRVTKPLPFPADLIETLTHSAAYVDYAGYLAKYATKQFDKLDASYQKLEKKSEAKDAMINKLNGRISELGEENKKLVLKNKDLDAQIKANQKAAEARERALQEKLEKALKALQESETERKGLQKHIMNLNKYIAEDKRKDCEREREFAEHDAKDHKALEQAAEALKEANADNARLQRELDCKTQIISGLTADLQSVRDQLDAANTRIRQLTADVEFERCQKAELQEKLSVIEKKLADAVRDLEHLRAENATLACTLAAEKQKNAELQAENGTLKTKLAETEHKLNKAEADKEALACQLASVKKELESASSTIARLESEIEDKAEEIKLRERECETKERRLNLALQSVALANEETNKKDEELDLYKKIHEKAIKEYKLELAKFKTPQVAVTEIKPETC